MNKFEKTYIYFSLFAFLAAIPVLGYYTFHNYYPFVNSIVDTVVPTDRKLYYPGDYVAFHVDSCYKGVKYSEVNYQLESETKDGHLYYMSLGSFKSISRDGCFNLIDINAHIPSDFFERNESVKEGKHRLYVTITEPQNTSKPIRVYQSDWFEIRRRI